MIGFHGASFHKKQSHNWKQVWWEVFDKKLENKIADIMEIELDKNEF